MNKEWPKSEQKDDRTAAEIIRDRIEMIGAVFSRKVTDEMIAVFQEALDGYPKSALRAAFVKAERELEKFPTPKIMRLLCNECMPSQGWKYNLVPSTALDPEFGNEVGVLLDPDPNCSVCREPRSGHPVKLGKIRCEQYTPSELGDDSVMFRPQDCPEGREFLKRLAEVAGRIAVPREIEIVGDAPLTRGPKWPHLIGKGLQFGK